MNVLNVPEPDFMRAKITTARFYAECIATEAPALELAVTEGAGAIADAAAVFAA